MSEQCHEFLHTCLLFDIEVNEQNRIYSIGAVFQGERFLLKAGTAIGPRQLRDLDAFAAGATFILGHNIISHDIPRIAAIAPDLELLCRPAIDTLYLSPLAYPENPYHRLVKDYQLVRDSVNDPAEDALLAGRVFEEQWQAFTALIAGGSDAPLLYRSFLRFDSTLRGSAAALGVMGAGVLEGDDLIEAFAWLAAKEGCRTAAQNIVDQFSDTILAAPPLAYVTAWLTVSGGNSILPPWVRHRFPEVPALLHQLRENACDDPACSYCRRHHDPRYYLRNFFDFDEFRAQPATEDGRSLQEEIIRWGARNRTLFATLPTGGGKSLCYLLPALMRYLHRNMITIVISPLQALMKDQVDNFSRQTGTGIAAALYGMMTMPERGEIHDRVRLGDIGILYVSPEQLRNASFVNTVSQREIGAWVFDEAHCLSKWGHDFRPDYLYAIRFIREFAGREKSAIPAVQCFTATAKKDVRAEITDVIQSELGLKVTHFSGGHERLNLRYEVWPVERYGKNQAILDLLRSRFHNDGSVVIYCATRKGTEKLAELLEDNGYAAKAFHAGLDPSLKKRIQDDFISGTTPIICATNAFGMGIDKDDVRLVVHVDIPGSLENYLQEAGRAGRDRKRAECILIFADQDIESQFRLSSMSRLSKRDIAQLLRGIRSCARDGDTVVLTAGELLRMDVVDIDSDVFSDPDTRVRTAIAWLEKAGYLQRDENNTRIFQGKPLVRDMAEARDRIAGLGLSQRQEGRWLAILAALMEQGSGRGFSTDELASLSAFGDGEERKETQQVLRTLHDMADQGILSKEITLSAYIRFKVADSSEKRLERVCNLERDFLRILQESAPEVEIDVKMELDLRLVNQQLLDMGHERSSLPGLKLFLYGLSRDGKGLAGQKGSISVKARGNNRFSVYLHREWLSLLNTAQLRRQAAVTALRTILANIPPAATANADQLVDFTLEQIVAGLRGDLLQVRQLKDPPAAAERALTFMHEQGIIVLQQGLAVFRQAMTIRLNRQARRKRYSQNDFAPLKTHYAERNFQIHVMNEYARRALQKLGAAMQLVASYFNDDKRDFVKRFFPGREKLLERATGEQSWQRIVDDLNNDIQEKIVGADSDRNMLVLAGPGSGKTRVVAHRVAFLLRVKRVRAGAVLVLCFNRSAVMSLRRRLRDLVGDDMNGVVTLTFHGLALRLTGRSLAAAGIPGGEEPDFGGMIDEAIRLLKGEADSDGFGDLSPRDVLIGRFSHILLDEYQDIDAGQYELVSLLAGRILPNSDEKLTILAVGDDDQNIYRFRGANVGFIRRFHDDYGAEVHYLIENYRATANIIRAANALIGRNRDRMKTGHPIEINRARRSLPAGGNWQLRDRISEGRVQCLEVSDGRRQAAVVVREILRLQLLDGDFRLEECAVLAREWKDLDPVRAAFEEAAVPVRLDWGRSGGLPNLARIRENAVLLEYLRTNRQELMSATALFSFLPADAAGDTLWQANLRTILSEWREETDDIPQPVPAIEEFLHESFTDQGRAKNIGNGVYLSTIHSVKGLEFDHVVILGDNWKVPPDADIEEERRLYYVGMSRARQTLHLCTPAQKANPHVAALAGDFLVRRTVEVLDTSPGAGVQYRLLGMKDLFLDFAGLKQEDHAIHGALGRLRSGDHLRAEASKEVLELVDDDGVTVARLSKAAHSEWRKRLDSIVAIRIIAIIRRRLEDIRDDALRGRCHGHYWEVPLVEITHRKSER